MKRILIYAIIVVEFSAGFGWSGAIERFLEKEKFGGRKTESEREFNEALNGKKP